MTDEAVPVPREGPPEPPMGLLRRFGSRNHPKTLERRARMQKARAGMAVSEETLATFTAARAFLSAEWLGASLASASVAILYLLVASAAPGRAWVGVAASFAMFAVGGAIFMYSHRYYIRLDFPWAKRWDNGAIVVAGAGAVFWLLFALLAALVAAGVRIGPG